MKFFLDFEANQFSDRIISIGCVSETGETFHTYVNPREKLKSFITDLTDITTEILMTAPGIEVAMSDLYDFIQRNRDEKPDFFLVYGHGDSKFLAKAAKDLYDLSYFDLSNFAEMLSCGLIDYSEKVKHIFGVKCGVALQKLSNYLNSTEQSQKHDALEDALNLKEVYEKLYCASPEQYTDNPFKLRKAELNYNVSQKKKKSKSTVYIAIDIESNNDYVLNDIKDLMNLVLKKLPNNAKRNNVHNRIMRAMRTKGKYAGYYFESYCNIEEKKINE